MGSEEPILCDPANYSTLERTKLVRYDRLRDDCLFHSAIFPLRETTGFEPVFACEFCSFEREAVRELRFERRRLVGTAGFDPFQGRGAIPEMLFSISFTD